MENIMIIIRLIFLFLSFYGYIQHFRRYIQADLAISFTFCTIGSILFFAGILNILSETAWCIAFAGTYLAVVSLRRKNSLRKSVSWGLLFCCAGAVFFILLLHGCKFTTYDNFSHWAVVSKVLIQKDRFPSFDDTYIMFQSYPLGSAIFIYYCTEIVGISSEWFQAVTQAILLLGMMSGIFTFTSKRSSVLLACVGSVILMCSNMPFTDLTVDTLLSLTGFAGVAFCIYYRDDLLKKLPFTIPYSIFLINVKNSGIFFVAVIIGLSLYYTKNQREKFAYRIVTLFSPFLGLLLWKKHVKLVFQEGLRSKHSMSISNFTSVFQDKSPEDVSHIITAICRRTFSLSNPGMQLLLIGVVLWLLCKYIQKASQYTSGNILCGMLISYIVYQIGTTAMFLFSMPREEAVILASYNRYHLTVLAFMAGLILIDVILILESASVTLLKQISLSALCVIGLYFTLTPSFSYLTKQDLTGTDRERFDYLVEGYGILPDSKYAFVISEEREDYGYLWFLIQYTFDTLDFSVITDNRLDEINWNNYDYIIFFEETDVTNAFMAEHYPDVIEPVVYLNTYR